MKKSDLKSGMLVEYRNGYKRMIMSHNLVDENGRIVSNLSVYNEELCSIGYLGKELDIMKVYDVYKGGFDFECKHRNLLWERKETPKLSHAELTILENIDKKYKYIARDEDNSLYLHLIKPIKEEKYSIWSMSEGDEFICIDQYKHLFTFVTWEDEKPRCIKELLS